jgi:hypothetical protein
VHLKHGRYSRYLKHLPADLRKGYQAALKDKELVSLRDELGLLSVRVTTLLDRLSATEAPPWQGAVEALNDWKAAKEAAAKETALANLETIIRSGASAGASQAELWAELREVIQEKVKAAALEWRQMVMIHVADALLFVRALMEAARDTITDKDQYRQLMQRTLALLPPAQT